MCYTVCVDITNVTYYYIIKDNNDSVFTTTKGMRKMGIIVCQSCEKTIEHFEEEKVTTLYAKCNTCTCHGAKEENK
jgi:hypothetical protein